MATTITKSIGTTARDYATAALFEAAIPANLLTTDEIWLGEVYNDSELTGTAGCVITGHTVDATRYIEIKPASGEGFKDGVDQSTDKLVYTASHGASFRNTSGTNYTFDVDNDYVFLRELQIGHDNYAPIYFNSDGGEIVRCIIFGSEGEAYTGVVTLSDTANIINCFVENQEANTDIVYAGWTTTTGVAVIDCTLMNPSDISNSEDCVDRYYGTNTVEGCALFGCANALDSNITTGDYNGTDDNAVQGANSVTSLTFADQFEGTTSSTVDARVATGSGLLAANTTHSESGGVDIYGNTRDATNPNIGCWEYTAPAGGGRIMSSLAGAGGLAYHGGIAGRGGGLAG